MKLSTTTGRFYTKFGFLKAIDYLADAGYDALDFSQFNKDVYEVDFPKEYFLEIRKYAEDKGLCFNQSHAPYGSLLKMKKKPPKDLKKL